MLAQLLGTPRLRWTLAALVLLLQGGLWWKAAAPLGAGQVFGRYPPARFAPLLLASYGGFWIICFLLGHGSLRRWARVYGLAALTLLVFLVPLEAAAVFNLEDYRRGLPLFPQTVNAADPAAATTSQPDPELLYMNRPNQHLVGDIPGGLVPLLGITTETTYHFDVQYDSRGYRNDHEIGQAPIVAIGDSFVGSFLVSYQELLTTRLHEMLQVEVANFGTAFYGPQQEYIVLKRYGLQLQPEIVLWFFFEGNDLSDVRHYEEAMRNAGRWHSVWERSFTRNSLLALAYLTAPRADLLTNGGQGVSCVFSQPNSKDPTILYFGYGGSPLSQDDWRSLEVAQQYFRDARDLAASQNARFVFIYVPTKFRVYHELCTVPAGSSVGEWHPNDLPSVLRDWSREQAIPYFDLTPALRAAAAHGQLVYYPDDTHWNAQGNGVAAEAIGAYIHEHGWLRGSDGTSDP